MDWWKFGCHLLLYFTFLVEHLQALSLTSTLEEGAACPGDVLFTCSAAQTLFLEWNSDLFQDFGGPVRLTPSNQIGQPVVREKFRVELISISNRNLPFADLASTLRVVGSDTAHLNGTVVNCTEQTATGRMTELGTVYIAVPPSPPTVTLPGHRVQQYGRENATIVVEWGEPEDNGWAPVNYTISVSGLDVSTTVTVRQEVLVLPYNMPLNITIVATNCAGSSDSALVEYLIVNCSDPCHPVRGTLEVYDSTLEGSEIFYHCSEGLVPEERMTSTCGADGNWSPNPAELVCSADCGVPYTPFDGAQAAHYNGTTEGSVVVYQCSTGPVSQEAIMAVCSSEGNWMPNPDILVCLVDCGIPMAPQNGSLSDTIGTTQGSEAVFFCDPGLEPSGQRIAVCTAAGNWVPNPANFTCREPGDSITETVTINTSTVNTDTSTVVIVAIVSSLLSFATGAVVGGLMCYWFTRKERKSQCVSCPKEEARPSVYEDVGPPRGDIEMKENVAYGPVRSQ